MAENLVDLIDKDVLDEVYRKCMKYAPQNPDNPDLYTAFRDGVNDILRWASNLSDSKRNYVVHGHWMYRPYRGGWHCSNCDNLRDEYDDVEYPPEEKYCCECGAKMDEAPVW